MSIHEKRYLTIEEVISLPSINDVKISNDGKNIAFVKKTVDWGDNEYRSRVWIYEKDNKKSYPLTSDKIESTNPLWSPDSKNIAYLSTAEEDNKEGKKKQIFIKDVNGYSGVQVTNKKEEISKFKWAPNGKRFYFLAKAPEDEAIKKRKEVYGDFEYVDKEYQCNWLYYIDIQEGIQKLKESYKIPKDFLKEDDTKENDNKNSIECQLIDGEKFHIIDFDVSPDGKKIAFIAVPSPNMEDYQKGDLYILDVDTKAIRKINKKESVKGSIKFSVDGTKICYTRTIREREYYKNNIDDGILEIYDINLDKFIQPVPDFDRSIMPIAWIDNGILVEWQDKTNYLVGILKDNGELNTLDTNKDGFTMAFSATKDGKHIAYMKAEPQETFEVYLDNERITNQNSVFKDKLKSKKEIISWESSDGLRIEGVLSIPHNFDKLKKYPLLVTVHGGPTWASFPIHGLDKIYPIEQFVEKGFLVLEPNYRGSSGYGDDFLKANYKKLGIGDYDDVISGVDMLVEEGFVDKNKVGIMGWSQGGYISAFCATYSDKFKAISVGAGISNWITYYANTDIHQFTRMYLGDNPWDNPEIYKKTSPMTYIKSACTPVMIQHGEEDTRVPVPNAYELYQGLKDMGNETELIIFKGMNHSPNKPGINRAIMEQNFKWFTKHILCHES